MLDLLIRDAQIVDGTGAPARHGDVRFDEGRSESVGDRPIADDEIKRHVDPPMNAEATLRHAPI